MDVDALRKKIKKQQHFQNERLQYLYYTLVAGAAVSPNEGSLEIGHLNLEKFNWENQNYNITRSQQAPRPQVVCQRKSKYVTIESM